MERYFAMKYFRLRNQLGFCIVVLAALSASACMLEPAKPLVLEPIAVHDDVSSDAQANRPLNKPAAIKPRTAAKPHQANPAVAIKLQRRSYRYYSQEHLYYAPHSKLWYWNDIYSGWQSGAELPQKYASALGDSVMVEIKGDKPYQD